MSDELIPVAAPMLVGNEKAYVMDCLDSTWISSSGKYIDRFERAFAEFCGVKHAVSCSNGTTALHAALLGLGVGPGDEVLVPSLTFVATANAVTYCGARPVFVDSEPDTWNIDPAAVEARITERTRGIIPVHLFGHPADMGSISRIARRHGLFVLEDGAQAHGGEWAGRRVGSMGDAAAFSFYGNKIVSTGEGGMVVTDDDGLAQRVRMLHSQGMDPARRYWFPVVGYNYRMTNVAAAIGLGQLERIAWHLERREEVVAWYREELAGASGMSFQAEREWARHVWWMFSVVLEGEEPTRDEVMAHLRVRGIETRPFVHPLHSLPPYRQSAAHDEFVVADRLGRQGINLPTWGGLSRGQVRHVCDSLLECFAMAHTR